MAGDIVHLENICIQEGQFKVERLDINLIVAGDVVVGNDNSGAKYLPRNI